VILTTLSPGAAAGADASFGIGAGYFFPFGDWTKHRFAGVDQFGGGIAVDMDFEWRVVPRLGLAMNAGYVRLGVGEWEDYAAAQGDDVDASAQMLNFGILVKPYLWFNDRQSLKLDLGLGVFFPDGKETFDDITYDYDFLKTKLGVSIGLEFDHSFNRNVALQIKASCVLVPSGVEYADGLSYTITGAPITVGLRYYF
jgi:hypothetical protein